MSFNFTNNIIQDTREKSARALALVAHELSKVSKDGVVVRSGLGLRGADWALEMIDEETGEARPYPHARIETKWMSDWGPTDLFQSCTVNHDRLEREMAHLSEVFAHNLFLIEGKASDLRAHETQGGVSFDKTVLPNLLSISARYRIPFIFSERAAEWLVRYLTQVKLSSFNSDHIRLIDGGQDRDHFFIESIDQLDPILSRPAHPGAQFFCTFSDKDLNGWAIDEISRRLILEGCGFWFLDGYSEEAIASIVADWQGREALETGIRAAGGFTEPPENYQGKLKNLGRAKGDFYPRLKTTRRARRAAVIFSDKGDEPLILLFEIPKLRGAEVRVLMPVFINGEAVDLSAIESATELYQCPELFKIKSDGCEADLLPELLRRCRNYWGREKTVVNVEGDQCESGKKHQGQSVASLSSSPRGGLSEALKKIAACDVEEWEQLPIAGDSPAKTPALESVTSATVAGGSQVWGVEQINYLEKDKEMNLPAKVNSTTIFNSANQGDLERAALKACGLAGASKETQILALNMANKFQFSLELKHIIPIQGSLYITRDGLLSVAHRSGQFDGMEVLEQGGNKQDGWWARVSVFRKDMSRPFTYRGRYDGPNKKFGPEMAVKCAESMALRRAFDVALCSKEERWDQEEVKDLGSVKPVAPRREEKAPPQSPAKPAPTIPASGGQHQAPNPVAESANKDQILAAVNEAGIPLEALDWLAGKYGAQTWDAWSPNVTEAKHAQEFALIHGWIAARDEAFSFWLIDEGKLAVDMPAGSFKVFKKYFKENCHDAKNANHFQDVVMSALDDASIPF